MRKVSYARYRQYVENEISVDVIAPIRQYWLTHIIELIPGDLHAVENEGNKRLTCYRSLACHHRKGLLLDAEDMSMHDFFWVRWKIAD